MSRVCQNLPKSRISGFDTITWKGHFSKSKWARTLKFDIYFSDIPYFSKMVKQAIFKKFEFPWREHTTKSMRIWCNPNEFRLKTKAFWDIEAPCEQLKRKKVVCYSSMESLKPIDEDGTPKNSNFIILEKIGPRIEKRTETRFEACKQVLKSEGALWAYVAWKRDGRPPIHWNIY